MCSNCYHFTFTELIYVWFGNNMCVFVPDIWFVIQSVVGANTEAPSDNCLYPRNTMFRALKKIQTRAIFLLYLGVTKCLFSVFVLKVWMWLPVFGSLDFIVVFDSNSSVWGYTDLQGNHLRMYKNVLIFRVSTNYKNWPTNLNWYLFTISVTAEHFTLQLLS